MAQSWPKTEARCCHGLPAGPGRAPSTRSGWCHRSWSTTRRRRRCWRLGGLGDLGRQQQAEHTEGELRAVRGEALGLVTGHDTALEQHASLERLEVQLAEVVAFLAQLIQASFQLGGRGVLHRPVIAICDVQSRAKLHSVRTSRRNAMQELGEAPPIDDHGAVRRAR